MPRAKTPKPTEPVITFSADVFPDFTDADLAFSANIPNYLEWRKVAYDAISSDEGRKILTPYCNLASSIFFKGGKIPSKRDDVTEEEYIKGKNFFKIVLSSWAPKHEDKELICGYILSRISKI